MKKKINDILNKMSLEDKIVLCSGKDFWYTKGYEKYGIPSIMMTDGPHGLRKQKGSSDMLGINESVPATCFPTAVTLASTWNRELIGEVARAIGEEAKALDVPVVLGPGLNIKRNPLCGRNFEYMSEDPYVAGEMGSAYVKGMQSTGVASSLKHFAVNSQEYKRFSSDSQLDDRTLREIYLAGFETVIKEAQPKTVMCAYNKINGTYCSDNKVLLTDILRKEWGFEGLVVTDWGAMNDRIESFKAGCDLSMPGGSSYMEKAAKKAVEMGLLSEETINQCVVRVIRMALEGKKLLDEKSTNEFDVDVHHELCAKAASEGIVLLQNDEHILPIDKSEKVLLVGYMAQESRYQGAGSSHICPTKLDSLVELLPDVDYVEGCDKKGGVTSESLSEISSSAKKAKKVIVIAGLTDQYESEGFDRDTIDIPQGHIDMIKAVTAVNSNVIVVLMGGSVMSTYGMEEVKGLVYAGLSGQAGAKAIVDVLYGNINPSGKLTETWPISISDVPSYGCYAGRRKDAQYREGIYVGYRYYDKAKVPVRFSFGYGLSYTSFEYSNLQIVAIDEAQHQYKITANILNRGAVTGAEVVQLYISNPQDGIYRPIKELKGFEKVSLNPGESKEVQFILNERSFAIYQDGFKVPRGKYEIMIGASSADIRLSEKIDIKGVDIPIPSWQKGSWYETPSGYPELRDWGLLMGGRMEDEPELKRGTFTINNTLRELSDFNFIAKIMCGLIEKQIAKGMGIEPDYTNPEFRMSASSSVDSSMRGMIISSCGAFPERMAKAIVEMANGHKLKGIKTLIYGR